MILHRKIATERTQTVSATRVEFEALLVELGFEPIVSKIDSSRKMWSHSKISYLHIFTKSNGYILRLYSKDNPNYDSEVIAYKGQSNLLEVLSDVV